MQILSNIAEMELDNAALLWVLGHRLRQLNHLALNFMQNSGMAKKRGIYFDVQLFLIRLVIGVMLVLTPMILRRAK